jgi:hypothetical protein
VFWEQAEIESVRKKKGRDTLHHYWLTTMVPAIHPRVQDADIVVFFGLLKVDGKALHWRQSFKREPMRPYQPRIKVFLAAVHRVG